MRIPGLCLIACILPWLQACSAPGDSAVAAKSPLTGKIDLTFLRKSGSLYVFKLANLTEREIRLRADFEKSEGAYPWDFLTKCRDPVTGSWLEAPYTLVDGRRAEVALPSGAEVLVSFDLEDDLELLKTYRANVCRIELRLLLGEVVDSAEFPP